MIIVLDEMVYNTILYYSEYCSEP